MKLVGHEDPLVGRQLEPAKDLRCQEHQIWVLFFCTCCVTIFVIMCKVWAAFFEEYPPWLLQILQVVFEQQRWRDKLSKLSFKMFQVFLVYPTPTNFSANVTRKIRKKSSIFFFFPFSANKFCKEKWPEFCVHEMPGPTWHVRHPTRSPSALVPP